MGRERKRRIDGIQPFAQLAEGNTTTVYKGYQERLDRFVLLKVLRPALARDEELARRFEEEAQLVAQIQHPNVVTIYDYGRTEDEQTYLATEFIEGTDLRGLLEDSGSLPPALAALVLREAATGLRAAHERGILHRDLKPANVLLASGGQVKLTDFGMASAQRDSDAGDGELRGTPAYMAPEYVSGDAPSERGDLFALGAILHEMLTARRAFTGERAGDVLDAVRHHDPLPVLDRFARPPEPLREIAEKLLARDPAERYASAGALLDDVNAFLRSQDAPPSAAGLATFLDDPEAYRRETTEAATLAGAAGSDRGGDDRPAASDDGTPAVADEQTTWRRFAQYGLALALGGAALWAAFTLASSEDAEPPPPADLEPPATAEESTNRPSFFAGTTGLVADSTAAAAGSTLVSAPGLLPPVPERVDASTSAPAETTRRRPEPPPDRNETTAREDRDVSQRAVLQVRVFPWAEVFVGGTYQGRTPLEVTLAPGEHEVVLKNDRFPHSVRKTVRVAPGEERIMRERLVEYVGRLAVEVAPVADVYIDGTYRGTRDTTQSAPFIVAPGEHTIRLENPRFGSHTTTFRLEAGRARSLVFNLKEIIDQ
jgi:serine/threonine-protein kinase